MRAYQTYIHELEALHGWLQTDLVHNCFLMGEEVGELFKAIRKYERYYTAMGAGAPAPTAEGERHEANGDAKIGAGEDLKNSHNSPAAERKTAVAEEIVDVFNYLLALANRLDIDLEQAFREKNAYNQERSWSAP